jgi:hypothetical protein
MSNLATNLSARSCTPQARRCRHLDAELKFCRGALLRGNALANQGQLESASRDVWLVEDTACAIESMLAKVEDAERLLRYQREFDAVQKELSDLRNYLCISPIADPRDFSH